MPLKLLIADRKLGAASKLAFLQLWEFAGRQPGRVTITADWLGGVCGRSPKAAWLWLVELEKHDLIELGERNERRGTVQVDLYNPCPGNRAATTDFQTRLPLQCDGVPPSAKRSCETASGQSEVTAPKPPAPLVPKKDQELSYQSTKDSSKNSTNSSDSMRLDASSIVAAIDADPAQQKERLKRKILGVCGGLSQCSDWVAGSAANLVVYHEVPLGELLRILADVQAMREVGTLQHAGRFFHAKARQLAARLGKPWPRSKEAVR